MTNTKNRNTHYHVADVKTAWYIANTLMPAEYELEYRNDNTGYPIYRSVSDFYDYICDLGNRLEVNLHNGAKSINIWITHP